jgi:hypothetical protein
MREMMGYHIKGFNEIDFADPEDVAEQIDALERERERLSRSIDYIRRHALVDFDRHTP